MVYTNTVVSRMAQRFAIFMLVLALSSGLFAQAKIKQSAEFVPNRVIVKFKPGVSASKTAQFESNLKTELRASVAKRLDLIHAEVWDISVSVQDAVAQWKNNPNIEYIEPDYIVHASVTPNDPDFAQLWGMTKIQAPQAWDTETGSDVLIGVIDTGVDYNHPDLVANIWTNPGEIAGNGIDDDGNGYIDDIHGYDFYNNDGDPMDDHSHGTHVSGTIAAVGNNSTGVVGVNWTAKIMAIKFLGSGGSGPISGAISAVQYATQMGAQLTNNSWGGGGYSQALYDAIQAAGAANSLFVAAAGNDYHDNDVYYSYPASYDLDNIISVAATDINDQKANFSNYGATTVDLGAPGVNILSTVPNSGYASYQGTSMASPHVAGVAGLIWALRPELSTEDVKAIILNSADPIAALSGITVTGARLNAYNAVTLAQTWTPLTPPAVTVSPTSFTFTEDPDVITTDAFSISNANGSRKLYWNISYDPVNTWLSVDKSSGTLSGGENEQITMSINTTGLIAGNYQCTLSVNSNDPNNPTVQVTVDLTVNYLPPPVANVTPTSLTYSVNTGDLITDQLTISNDAPVGNLNLHWSASIQGSVPGISINPSSGTAAPGTNNTMQVSINTAGVNGGTYQGSIEISTNDPSNQLASVPVDLTVNVPVVGGQKLYVINSGTSNGGPKILRMELDGSNPSFMFSNHHRPINGDLDKINRKIYWFDWTNDALYNGNLNGTGQTTVLGGLTSTLVSIALDVPNNYMYYIVQSPQPPRIVRADLDGSNPTELIQMPGQYWVHDLALDVANGKMYWTNEGVWRADIDGNNPVHLVPLDNYNANNAMAIDTAGGKVYWTQTYPNSVIMRANLADGSNPEALLSNPPGSDIFYSIELDLIHNKIYWSGTSWDGSNYHGSVYRADLQVGATPELVYTDATLDFPSIILDLSNPPVAAADNYNTPINTTLTTTASDGLLSNDDHGSPTASLSSFGGDSLGGDVTTNAAGASVTLAGGTLTINADGSFSLTTPTVAGSFTFQYRATNTIGTSDALVTIEVRQVPTAVADNYTTPVNTSLSRSASDSDDFLDNDTRGFPVGTITSFGGGSLGSAVTDNAAGANVPLAGGNLTVNADGSFSLTTPTVIGSYNFDYRLQSAIGSSDATVSIEVQLVGSYDIYTVNTKSGNVVRVTSIDDADEYNPSFAPDGGHIVHDVSGGGAALGHSLYITDVSTGVSVPLTGGEGGNDASWSPDSMFIAFDRSPVGDPSVYVLPSSGGTPAMVRANAVDAEWSNNSKRLVFQDITDGSLRTVDLSGGSETTVAASGQNPSWSPNGKVIAFSDGNNIFAVAVNQHGKPRGTAKQLTHDGPGVYNSQPSWSNNSKTIVFHSNRESGDFDIWTVSVSGGTPAQLAGNADFGDYDPSYSKNGKYVAYAGFTDLSSSAAAMALNSKTLQSNNELSVPDQFRLEQNYPNPFNPTTSIQFALPQAENVTLRIYNLTGQLVRTLISANMDAGYHNIRWDATNQNGSKVASGIYIYRLTAGSFVRTRKMILMK